MWALQVYPIFLTCRQTLSIKWTLNITVQGCSSPWMPNWWTVMAKGWGKCLSVGTLSSGPGCSTWWKVVVIQLRQLLPSHQRVWSQEKGGTCWELHSVYFRTDIKSPCRSRRHANFKPSKVVTLSLSLSLFASPDSPAFGTRLRTTSTDNTEDVSLRGKASVKSQVVALQKTASQKKKKEKT